jgi:Fe-S-cluster containining protein
MPSGDDESQKPRVRLPVLPEDVERGLRFNHIVGHQTRKGLAELAASYYALVETLVARGVVPLDEYERRRQDTMKREEEKFNKELAPQITNIPDKYKLEQLPEIDCEARLHLCKAGCCKLHFSLSLQDLDERVVRWDYARPYQIGRRDDGYCVHNIPGTCMCNVYEHRPGVCRKYDCREDKRIWKDFNARIPADAQSSSR